MMKKHKQNLMKKKRAEKKGIKNKPKWNKNKHLHSVWRTREPFYSADWEDD